MKIAALASNNGEKIIYLYEFFKEGNRIKLEYLLTDRADSPVAKRLGAEGVAVIPVGPESDFDHIIGILKGSGVELIVDDDFPEPLPQPLKDAFGDAIVSPSSPESAPLEVIKAADLRNAAVAVRETKKAPDRKKDHPLSAEEEWADVLKVSFDPEEADKKNEEATLHLQDSERQPEPTIPNHPEAYSQQPVQQEFRQAPPAQPQGNMMPPEYREPEPMPETNLVWAVVVTILCCLIPGIIAIIYSASVSSKYYAGDYEGARRASRRSQIWCIVAVVTGILWLTFYFPLALFMM